MALTYTLEEGYGSKIVVPGAGFLLNNEMGDFNAEDHMNTRLFGATALATVLMLNPLAAAPAPAAPATATVSVPVTGSVDDGGRFVGTLAIQRFAAHDGRLVAVGTVTGTLTKATGETSTVLRTVSLPVTASTAATGATSAAADGGVGTAQIVSCGILHLELGPLDLDLLGLVVHLDRVVLDVSAEPGAGNLLGNLLCAIVGLLDAPGALTQIVNLLNQLLSILG